MSHTRRRALLCMAGVMQMAQADSATGGHAAGAAPPALLSSGQMVRLREILSRFRTDTLTPDDARQLWQSLRAGGFKAGPALDAELQRNGLSLKQLATLVGPEVPALAGSEPASSPGARKVPRPQ